MIDIYDDGPRRLWAAVALQAVLDGCGSGPLSCHRREAREYIAGDIFASIWEQFDLKGRTGLSVADVRRDLDKPELWQDYIEALGGRRATA